MDITDVKVLRQFETSVPGPDGINRFITIVGVLRIPLRGAQGAQTYRYLIGPAFQPHEVLGVSYLPSVAALNLDLAEMAGCTMNSFDAEFDVDSGRVEATIELLVLGAVESISVVFSLTILTAS
jgi:hypothetical protein